MIKTTIFIFSVNYKIKEFCYSVLIVALNTDSGSRKYSNNYYRKFLYIIVISFM